MTPELHFNKALLLLDRGKIEEGKDHLYKSISLAEEEDDSITLVRSLVCLGELLYQLNDKETAKAQLTRALTFEDEIDFLSFEYERANELLSNI